MGKQQPAGREDNAQVQDRELPALRKFALSLLIAGLSCLAGYLLLEITAQQRIGLGELARLPVIEDWYREHASQRGDYIVVLGDSLGRSAFNARLVNEEGLAGGRQAWNLASSARTYPEMMLDIGRPALADSTVLLFVSPVTSFNPSKLGINPRKANVYGLLGLPGSASENFGEFGAALDPDSWKLLSRPDWQHVLGSRWRLPEYLKDSLQVSVGPRRERHRYILEEYCTDLQYPAFGGEPDPARLEESVRERLELLRDPSYNGLGNEASRQALRGTVSGLRQHCRRLVVVMFPLHPAYAQWLEDSHPEYDRDWLRQLLGNEVEILDYSAYSAAGLFRDDLHISDEASVQLTRSIMQDLHGSGGRP